MYIVVSNDPRIPIDLVERGVQVEQWTYEEFVRNASTGEGLELDEGLYYDVSILNSDIYEALSSYKEYNMVFYYRFDDMSVPSSVKINDDIIVYPTKAPEPDPEIEPDPLPESNTAYEPEPDPEPPVKHVIEEVPVVEEPTPPPQPVQPAYTPPPAPVQPVQPAYTPPPAPVQQPVYTPPVQQPVQSAYSQSTYKHDAVELRKDKPKEPEKTKPAKDAFSDKILRLNIDNMLQHDDFDVEVRKRKKKRASAQVIVFGSSKGGTGKTFTCLISAYWYAKTHPTEKVALADFDIIDGQIGITINKLSPTMQDYYKLCKSGRKDFKYLENCKVKSEHFSPNIDFYLAPSQDIPQVTNDVEFWYGLFQALIENYDIVFFDTGIDYLGKPPISELYKIADKIIITTNPSINSTKSVIKQFKTLGGLRTNNVFAPSHNILSKVNVVLTRVYDNTTINDIVVKNLKTYAPVVAKFGNIDKIISEVQWYQHWNLIDENPDIYKQLETIIKIDSNDDDEED